MDDITKKLITVDLQIDSNITKGIEKYQNMIITKEGIISERLQSLEKKKADITKNKNYSRSKDY